MPPLPDALRQAVEQLGRRASPADVRRAVLDLCAWHPLTSDQLAALLGRERGWLFKSYVRPLQREGRLALLYPETPHHPLQAYRTPEVGM